MIFTQSLQKVDPNNTQDAIKKMVNHIRYMQEQMEFTLHNLDSSNINEIDTGKTTITNSTGDTTFGSFIYLTGDNGESFTAGKNPKGKFEFAVEGKGGSQEMYLNSSGELIITKYENRTINGGDW